MDYRSNKILNRILKKQKVDIMYLSDIFHISERMVRKLVKELNEDLQKQGIDGLKIDSEGNIFYEELTPELEEKLKKFILQSDFYTYRLIPNERKTIEAMILMNSEGYQTAAELSEYLESSRNTIVTDLNELKDWFYNNKMTLSSQVQKGYQIEGKELNIRNGILKLLELNQDYSNYKNGEILDTFGHLLLKELQYEDRMFIIQKIVKEEEERHDVYFSDFSFMEVVFEVLILTKRISLGKALQETPNNAIKKSSKYPLSRAILNRVEESLEIEIPEEEKKNFVRCLRRKSYLKSSTTNVDEIAIPIMIGEAIYQISERFHISFYLDFALYDVLVDHMKSAIYRAQSGECLKNPFGNEIEKKYPEIFQVVEECVKPLEIYIRSSFQKDEISFLVMYFASMIEKDRIEKVKQQKVSAMIVGGMGRGTMRLLETELGKFDDILEIVQVKASHEMPKIDAGTVDMIISTVPYENSDIPTVYIKSPILKNEEVYAIRMTAMEILENRQDVEERQKRHIHEIFRENERNSFLEKNRIRLNVHAEEWEDAVRESGKLLYEAGLVNEEYIEAMIQNIKVNGNYIVIYPGLAIPHAEVEKGAIKEGISFVRLAKPVIFSGKEDEPVSYIVGLSVLNADSINDMLYNLVKMFSNDKLRQKMDDVRTEEEMYELIENRI